MSFFGGSFFVWATVLMGGWTDPLLLVPLSVYAVIATFAIRLIRSAPAGAFGPGPRAERIMTSASIAEGLAIPIVATGLANTGHADLVLPGIAIVVGLHFLPMAYAIPFPAFYLLAFAMLLVAAAGFVASQPFGSILAGILAACTLWIASILALRRGAAASRIMRSIDAAGASGPR